MSPEKDAGGLAAILAAFTATMMIAQQVAA